MNEEIKQLSIKFNKIKKMGWIKTIRNGNCGVGATLEKLLCIEENSLEIPDFDGIEIKARRMYSKSYITMFSSTPTGPYYHEIARIKELYGYPHNKYKNYNILNTSVYGNQITKVGLYNYFKLFVSRDKKKMFLEVYDFSKKLIENKTYWDFDILSEKLYRKMKVFALVEAQCKKIEGIEYFKYTSMTLYTLKNFDNFISLIEDGIIRISFKINIFTTEERFGQIYDHGTGFEISKENLEKLYNRIKVIQ